MPAPTLAKRGPLRGPRRMSSAKNREAIDPSAVFEHFLRKIRITLDRRMGELTGSNERQQIFAGQINRHSCDFPEQFDIIVFLE